MVKYTPPRTRFFKGKKRNVSFRFPEDLMEYYGELADELGISFTDLIIDVLDSTAEQLEKDRKKKHF